jgi:arylsulfatase A
VVNLDYSLGRLIQVLDETGLFQNSLVIFSSDNGPEVDAYQRIKDVHHFSMGPLRGLKRDLYEGGHRVPLVVSWPAVVKPGSVSDALVSLTDWYATIAAITSISPDNESGLDSMNILPILKTEAGEVRGLMLQDTAVNNNSKGIRVGPWMYIDAASGEENKNREPEWFRLLRGVEDAPGNEFYNLAYDLGQGKNRIARDAKLAARLKDLFDAKWRPSARSTPPFTQQVDTDGDGYSDFFEDIHKLDKHDPEDILADVDGDGRTNIEEVLSGSFKVDAAKY